jgi:hypothetical protein
MNNRQLKLFVLISSVYWMGLLVEFLAYKELLLLLFPGLFFTSFLMYKLYKLAEEK